MRQFIYAPDSALQVLRDRAAHACLRFRQQEMPTGCAPTHADVGFEFDGSNAKLHVQKGVAYTGASQSIREWLQNGTKTFTNLNALIDWVRGPLHEAFGVPQTAISEAPPAARRTPATTPTRLSATPADLTDMPAVVSGIREADAPIYIDAADLRDRLLMRIRGQDDAICSLASAVACHCARRHPKRPVVLFAVGPSGVGKTRTAEVLAEALAAMHPESRAYQFLRLDMSEYQEAHRVSQLIGSPQGYIGHGEGSQLLDTLTAHPKCIILFDEIEKAHSAILKVLMNAMDAGRLSSASKASGAHDIDCRQAIFLFTSNLDANAILHELQIKSAFGNKAVEDEVCRRRVRAAGVTSEIVGRIGRFLVFRPLAAGIRAEIMAGMIAEVAAEYGVNVTYVEPQVIIELMKTCRSDGFGMRPGQFMIDDALGAAFAAAARKGGAAFRVVGPPFECVLSPEPAATESTLVTHLIFPSRVIAERRVSSTSSSNAVS